MSIQYIAWFYKFEFDKMLNDSASKMLKSEGLERLSLPTNVGCLSRHLFVTRGRLNFMIIQSTKLEEKKTKRWRKIPPSMVFATVLCSYLLV